MRILRALGSAAVGALFAIATTGAASATEAATPTTIWNFATGKYLDHSLGNGVRAIDPNGGVYQKWWVHPWPDNTREIRNYQTGKCIEVNTQSQLIGVDCNQSRRQSWYIIENDYSRNHFVFSLKNQETGCVIDHSNTYGLRCIQYYGNGYQSWGIRDT